MKIAIIYTTKGGTTRECAGLLAEKLKSYEVSISEMKDPNVDLQEFDYVLVGFPIRMGKACREARKYIKRNFDALSAKTIGFFICCGFIDCFEDYKLKVIPDVLTEKAVDISCFGGSLDHKRFKWFDRIVVKAVRDEILGGGDNGDQRDDMSLPTILDENISQFAQNIKKYIELKK